jgi:hypothetical protein
MSSTTLDSAVLCNGFDSPLVNALRTLANSEKSRAEHAQQPFNYRGEVKWSNGINPFVVDPATFLYIPSTWDGTLVVLSYGITRKNDGTGATEPECLSSSRCATAKAAEEATKLQTQARVMQWKAAEKELKGALQAWGGVKLEEGGECV